MYRIYGKIRIFGIWKYIPRNQMNKYGGCAPGIREMLYEDQEDGLFKI